MPLEFSTGTINAANAGAVGLDMINQIRTDLVAHPAWELVEEYVPASVMHWYVFKCLAAESGLPNDFFVVIGRVIGSGKLVGLICEGYNAGTHTVSLYSTNTGSSSGATLYAYDAQGRQTTHTYALGITDPTGNAPVPRRIHWIPSGVSTKWWLTIDDDGFSVAFNGAANGWMHFGAYEWLGSLANPCPLHSLGSDSGQYNNITRNPAVAGGNFGHYALTPGLYPGSTGAPGLLLGLPGRLDRNDKLCNDERAVAELGMVMDFENTAGHVNSMESIGYILGKCKRMRYGTNPPAGVAFGDAYSHNGTLWVPYLGTDGRIWDTGVAA